MIYLLMLVLLAREGYTNIVVTSRRDQIRTIGHPGSVFINISGQYDEVSWYKDNKMLGKWPLPKEIVDLSQASVLSNGCLMLSRVGVMHNGTFEVRVSWNLTLVQHYPELTVVYPDFDVQQPAGNCTKLHSNQCSDPATTSSSSSSSTTTKRSFSNCFISIYSHWCQRPIPTKAPPRCVKIWAGHALELECDFVGFPSPRPEWSQISGPHRFSMKTNDSRITTIVEPARRKLVIANVAKEDQNTYVCTGMNSVGMIELQTRVKVYEYNKFCGVPVKYLHRGKRIVDGTPVKPKEWPWQVLISYVYKNTERLCGGAIINFKWVLSAAHCFVKPESSSSELVDPGILTVTVGVYNRLATKEKGRQSFKVKRIRVPSSGTLTSDSDIVLLELCSPIFFSKSARPVCIASVLPNPETECEVAGWGLTGPGKPLASVLNKAVVALVHAYECRRYYDYLTVTTICAGKSSGGANVCPGDSGSPLVCKREGKNQWEMIGLVSGGLKCGKGYSYYANAVQHRKWILETADLAELAAD